MLKLALNRISLLIMAAFLAGCASGADPVAITPTDIVPASKSSAYAGKIGSTTVTGGQETSPLWMSEISNEAFQSALDQALIKAGYKRQGGPLTVVAELQEVKQPFAGAALTVTTTVHYQIVNDEGKVLFDRTIKTPHKTAFSEAFLAVKRLKLANEGSAKANLTAFLGAIGNSR